MDHHQLVSRIKARILATRKRRALQRIREHLEFFGLNTEHLSDEEIEERSMMMMRAVNEAGASISEATAALSKMGRCMNGMEKEQIHGRR